MEPIKPTPEIYRKAAELIDKGWVQGTYQDVRRWEGSARCYCMEGAIMKAAGLDPGFSVSLEEAYLLIIYAERYVAKRMGRANTDYIGAVVTFNDDQTSKEPVIKMLNDIADALEKEQAE